MKLSGMAPLLISDITPVIFGKNNISDQVERVSTEVRKGHPNTLGNRWRHSLAI
jgi:hypothetical protein